MKNVAGRYEIDGKKVYAKAIGKDPEQYFTPDVMRNLMKLRSLNSVMVRDYHALPDDLRDALIVFEHDVKIMREERFKTMLHSVELNQHHGKIIPTLYQYFTEALDLYREEVSAAKYLPKVNTWKSSASKGKR